MVGVLLAWSVNLTRHGMDLNKESLLITATPNAVSAAPQRFEEMWELSRPLSQADFNEAAQKQVEKLAAKRAAAKNDPPPEAATGELG